MQHTYKQVWNYYVGGVSAPQTLTVATVLDVTPLKDLMVFWT
jgi:hypothetical protein